MQFPAADSVPLHPIASGAGLQRSGPLRPRSPASTRLVSYQKHCQLPFRIPTRNDHLTMYTMHLTTALSTLHYTSMVHYLSLRPLSETFVFNTALQTFRKPAVQYSSTAPPEHAKTNPAARCRGNRVGVSSR